MGGFSFPIKSLSALRRCSCRGAELFPLPWSAQAGQGWAQLLINYSKHSAQRSGWWRPAAHAPQNIFTCRVGKTQP